MVYANAFTARCRKSFMQLLFAKKYIPAWKRCKKIYNNLEEMQQDIDQWLNFYNNERTHSGRYCFGKTPMQTFTDSKELAQAKDVNNLFEQNNNFIMSDKADTGAAGKQPARNSLTDGNDKAVEQTTTASFEKSFLSQMP